MRLGKELARRKKFVVPMEEAWIQCPEDRTHSLGSGALWASYTAGCGRGWVLPKAPRWRRTGAVHSAGATYAPQQQRFRVHLISLLVAH